MSWVVQQLFGRRNSREAKRYVRGLADAPAESARRKDRELIANLVSQAGSKISFGETLSGEPVQVPLREVVSSHSLISGATGSGKTMFCLGVIEALIEAAANGAHGFGVLDAKGDLFQGSLFLLDKKIRELSQQGPKAARQLRRRIAIYDFSSRDPVSSYNILARWPNAEGDFFALNRADLLLDLLPGGDKLSLSGVAVLQKLLLLLSEFDLPITHLGQVLEDVELRNRLVSECRNDSVRSYFRGRFGDTPKSTIGALRRRTEALFGSEGVRLTLGGLTVPDFRRLQDEGNIVLINCFGRSIARSVRRLLQALVISDIRQAVFERRRRDQPYPWLCDEAQNFFATEKLRDNMNDLVTMARSYGSFFVFLTQNLGTAVQDSRMLSSLHTNIRWSFSMRGGPSDCDFLKPSLRVTGRKLRPQANPFEEKRFYTLTEERALALEAIAHLPDRVGHLWFKARSNESLQIRTRNLDMPQAEDLEAAIRAIRHDPSIGSRSSRKQYERQVAERDAKWRAEDTDLNTVLREAYRNAQEDAA